MRSTHNGWLYVPLRSYPMGTFIVVLRAVRAPLGTVSMHTLYSDSPSSGNIFNWLANTWGPLGAALCPRIT